MESIKLEIEEGKTAEFYVLEETTVGGIDYFLVTDAEEGEGEALILKDLSARDEEEAVFEFVEDEAELKAVADIFAELLEDTELV
ncbi:MAG: DUF1292 domain-containing protein [Lachnospiraceae bacterium]|nr:DUF1292 domain-containing protein [Lachnospiraceae bacterium]